MTNLDWSENWVNYQLKMSCSDKPPFLPVSNTHVRTMGISTFHVLDYDSFLEKLLFV